MLAWPGPGSVHFAFAEVIAIGEPALLTALPEANIVFKENQTGQRLRACATQHHNTSLNVILWFVDIYCGLSFGLRTYLFNINIHEWVQKRSVFDIVFMCNVALRPRTNQTNGLKFNIECVLSTATDDIVQAVPIIQKVKTFGVPN